MKISIPNYVYRDMSVSDREVLYYIWLKKGLNESKEFFDSLYGANNYSTKISTTFSSTIESLIDREFIYAQKINSHSYQVDKDEYIVDDNFALIKKNHIHKIMSSKNRDALQLVRYYCWLVGSMYKGKCDLPISYFANRMECSERTIIRYNCKLEELGVIKINHQERYKEHNVYMLT